MHTLPGWLNADLFPPTRDVLHLDASKPFPFEGDQFDYIFSEHMIEHVTYADGQKLLAEAWRVLKPRGKIRISTPDLAFIVQLYGAGKSDLEQDYMQLLTDWRIPEAPQCEDTFVINNNVRDWGHLFIYDQKALRRSMEHAGFTDVIARRVCDSPDPELRDLENVDRMPEGMVQLETFTLEATKP